MPRRGSRGRGRGGGRGGGKGKAGVRGNAKNRQPETPEEEKAPQRCRIRRVKTDLRRRRKRF